jgi:Xaa-Pro dipeptidase
MTTERLTRLYNLLEQNDLEFAAINPGPTLTYLTGLSYHLMERPTVLLLAPPAEPVMVLAELEAGRLENSRIALRGITYTDNPATWQAAFDKAAGELNLNAGQIAVEPARLRFLEMNYLQQAAPKARIVSGENVFAGLRMCKDAGEIEKMRTAVRIAQDALRLTLPLVQPGVTEKAIAAELTAQMLKAGSESEMPFAPLVASGPNPANPHHSASDRLLQEGDLLLIDWGATFEGYVSDLTRTFAIGEIDPELKQIHLIVQQANAAARAAARPGLRAGDVDLAARAVIEAAGYGEYFFHRVGHGLGMEGHEPPYCYAENDLILEPGMTFTIEPGIYLAGRGGVRIEDDVVITTDGAESLSDMERGLITLPH